MTESEILRSLRLALITDEISIRGIGAESGVGFSTISRLLRGKGKMSPQTRRALQAWLQGDPTPIKEFRSKLEDRIRALEQRVRRLEGKV